jgi:hypothetical protein
MSAATSPTPGSDDSAMHEGNSGGQTGVEAFFMRL